MRSLLPVATALLLLAAPALAETVAPAKGRYAIQPSDDGFVRLDTESGSVSHCTRVSGVWQCDGVATPAPAVEHKVDALAAKVDEMTREISSLKAEVAALKAAPPRQQRTELSPEDEKELDRALGFAERLMQRFFELVRDLRGDERPSI